MAVAGERRFEQLITGAALVVLVAGCAYVLRPFATSLLWAVVLWLATSPLHQRVLAWVGDRHTVAAVLMTLGVSLVLLMPIAIVGFSIADSAQDLTVAARHWMERPPSDPPSWLASLPVVGNFAVDRWHALAGDSQRWIEQGERWIEPATSWAVTGGLAIGRGMTELALSIFIAFFLYRDRVAFGDRFRAGAARVAGANAEPLLRLAINTLHSVVYGILGTAVVQGVMAGVGLLIAGVPGAVLLGLLTFFLSIVPMGPPLVWVPATVWLYQTGAPGWAVFMLIWGFGVSSIDNFLKPWLISQGSTLPFILIFFGVVGGVFTFGFIGVFLGPTLLAVGYRVLIDWAVVTGQAAPPGEPAPPA